MRPIFLLFAISLILSSGACKPKDEKVENTETATTKGDAFKIDVARSEVKWQAFKPVGEHHGVVPVLEGSFSTDGEVITAGTVVLDMKNLEVRDMENPDKENLQNHLRGFKAGAEDDFFNTNQYPTATYTVTSSSKLNGDPDATHMINGNLTMRGITKPVNFKAKVDMAAGDAIKITAPPFKIDRTEWGIKFMSKKFFDNLKDNFVNDDMQIEFTIGGTR